MTLHAPIDTAGLAPLARHLSPLSLPERLAAIRETIPGRFVLTTSFGLEDQALTHAAVSAGIDVEIVTLDTGRLFDETLELWAETEFRYGIGVRAFTAETGEVEALVARDGPMGFRGSLEARRACCAVRKIEPLRRALDGAALWLTGLRADQSAERGATAFLAPDADYGLLKASPLVDWDRRAVADYVAAEDIPINALHARGFASIGCAPCTRAIAPGEPERAGRWWWEEEVKKECGLHDHPAFRAEPVSAAEAA